MSLNKYTLTVRRESFIKAIRHEQREQFKAEQRAKMLEACNFKDEVWRFKMSLHTLDLTREQARAIKFIEAAQQYAHSEQFCHYLKSTLIIEQLIDLMVQSHRKQQTQMGGLVEKVLDWLYGLVARSNIFLGTVEKEFKCLTLLLYLYPTKNNLDKISQFLTFLQQLFKNVGWLQLYNKTKLIDEGEVIGKIMGIYILDNAYCDGEVEVNKYSHQWFKNAINCLQITYSLIKLHSNIHDGASELWESSLINEGLCQGLSIFIKEQEFTIEHFQEETCEIESASSPKIDELQGESNLYFISLILDIMMMRGKLLEQREVFVLKGVLQMLLKELNRYSIINLTAIKIITLLYEQVVFDEDELVFIANSYPHLTHLIHKIIENDFV